MAFSRQTGGARTAEARCLLGAEERSDHRPFVVSERLVDHRSHTFSSFDH